MILGSFYRAVLVFWCFKSVKGVEVRLSKLFQYRAFACWVLFNDVSKVLVHLRVLMRVYALYGEANH